MADATQQSADSVLSGDRSSYKESLQLQSLKRNSVGTVSIVFMAIATAAPITAMGGVVPISLGYGAGMYAPGGYIIAMIVLMLFSVGYLSMAQHITCAGAFYGFVSHGLGRVAGMASGLVVLMAYMLFEAAIVGAFAYFGVSAFQELFGVHIHWLVFAIIMLALNALVTYFEINIVSRILMVLLLLEFAILLLFAFATLAHGGGPYNAEVHTIPASPLNPLHVFYGVPGVGFGIFLAFWSWVGFESTAIYGEESRDPKKVIPRATVATVLGIGFLYVFVSWMVVAANGPEQAMAIGASSHSLDVYFMPLDAYVGHWAVVAFSILLMTGSYACGLAFHNNATRYLYAIGREGAIPRLATLLGRTHHKTQSPYVASLIQSAIATIIVLLFFAAGMDPFTDLFGLGGIWGTLAVLTAQCLCSFAVIGYFHGNKLPDRHWFKTFLAPLLSGLAFLFLIALLFQNKEAAAGSAADTMLFTAIPYIVYGLFVVGVLGALYLKFRHPDRYELVGRVVMEDTADRN